MSMLNKELEHTLNNAFRRAREQHHEYMTVEHLLLSLLDNASAIKALRACGANLERLRTDITSFITRTTPIIPSTPRENKETQPTLGFQRVLQRAVFHGQSSGNEEINGANVLIALFSEQNSQAVYFLSAQNIKRLDLINYVSHGTSKIPEESATEDQGDMLGESLKSEEKTATTPLDSFAINLNTQALKGKIDPLIGRTSEIERTIQILCRRRKNNPLLVGEAGVGKTAIAEGLARKIVD
ncbi:Clp protease ClpX, partial [Achromatium sp. WMS1]